MLKPMKKLNNESGKSIFMALFLLLVCVVVSVVIVTVAVTSVMHVEDNKRAQQEYLACASAVELINDCVDNATYTHETIVGTYTYFSYTSWAYSTESYRPDPTEKTTSKGMKNFIESISKEIKADDGTTAFSTGTFEITQGDMDSVNASYELLQASTEESLSSGEKVKKYNLTIYLEKPEDKDQGSHGYKLKMTIPITRSIKETTGGTLRLSCQNDWHSYEHDFDIAKTTVTVTWSKGSVSKGWS